MIGDIFPVQSKDDGCTLAFVIENDFTGEAYSIWKI